MRIRLIIIAVVILITIFFLTGCALQQGDLSNVNNVAEDIVYYGDSIDTIHDDINQVTCWIIQAKSGVGIDCMPDWLLVAPSP